MSVCGSPRVGGSSSGDRRRCFSSSSSSSASYSAREHSATSAGSFESHWSLERAKPGSETTPCLLTFAEHSPTAIDSGNRICSPSTPAAETAPPSSENSNRPSRFVAQTRTEVPPSYVKPVSRTSWERPSFLRLEMSDASTQFTSMAAHAAISASTHHGKATFSCASEPTLRRTRQCSGMSPRRAENEALGLPQSRWSDDRPG